MDVKNLSQTAKRLTKWAASVQTAWQKEQKKDQAGGAKSAKAAKKVKKEPTGEAASSVEVPIISTAEGEPVQAGSGTGETWGCSHCKWAQTGCLSCNPAKMARY